MRHFRGPGDVASHSHHRQQLCGLLHGPAEAGKIGETKGGEVRISWIVLSSCLLSVHSSLACFIGENVVKILQWCIILSLYLSSLLGLLIGLADICSFGTLDVPRYLYYCRYLPTFTIFISICSTHDINLQLIWVLFDYYVCLITMKGRVAYLILTRIVLKTINKLLKRIPF